MVWLAVTVVVVLIVLAMVMFTRTQEGTAQAIMTFGGLWRVVICWRGCKLDEKGDVVGGEDLSVLPGGLRFVGIRWINTVYKYTFRWQDYELDEGGVRKLQFHSREINYINLRPDVFAIKVEAMLEGVLPGKDKPERIKVTAVFLWTAEVFNPEKTLFHSPPNWNENATTKLQSLFARWLGVQEMDYLISLKAQLVDGNKKPIELWTQFQDDPQFKEFESWGFRTVPEKGIVLGALELPKDIEEAAEAQRERELEAKGVKAATADLVLAIMASARNVSLERMHDLISFYPDIHKEYMDRTMELVQNDQAAKVGGLSRIIVQGAGSGAEQALLNFAAILRGQTKGPGGVDEKKDVKTEAPKESSPVQGFWRGKRPMDRLHKKKKK